MNCSNCGHHRINHQGAIPGTIHDDCLIDGCHCRQFEVSLSELELAEKALSDIRQHKYSLQQQLTAACKEEGLWVSRVQVLRENRSTSI